MSKTGPLGFDVQDFLENYWQKKPLLVRNAFPGGLDYVDGDTLAGLSCQEGVESRLILEQGEYPWETKHGPFDEAIFSDLPETHWTLLVQAVDRLLPEVSALRRPFHFLPNWRIDDVMISYAPDQGTVGPHTDNYDVFLIQGAGRRRWDIHSKRGTPDEFIPDLDLKILQNFKPDESFELEAGDMLYLPPNLGHHGVALGESITYSVGFRAPTQKDLLMSFANFLVQAEAPDQFYADRAAKVATDPGLLTQEAMADLKRLMIDGIEKGAFFQQWIGGFLTEPRSFHEAPEEELEVDKLLKRLQKMVTIERVEGGRFAYHQHAGQLYFSVEGETMVLEEGLLGVVQHLCRLDRYAVKDLLLSQKEAGFGDLFEHLWNQGYIREGEYDG